MDVWKRARSARRPPCTRWCDCGYRLKRATLRAQSIAHAARTSALAQDGAQVALPRSADAQDGLQRVLPPGVSEYARGYDIDYAFAFARMPMLVRGSFLDTTLSLDSLSTYAFSYAQKYTHTQTNLAHGPHHPQLAPGEDAGGCGGGDGWGCCGSGRFWPQTTACS